jgi:O-antigen/teichoic acid export membrane protein
MWQQLYRYLLHLPNISFDLGIIQKQTITGSVISYLGVLLGFVTTGILFPQLFSTAENGVIKLLVANAALFGQLGTLGFSGVITRMFTYFRDKKTNHHGFMRIGILVSLAGFAFTALAFYFLKDWILIGKDKADGEMIGKLVGFVIPMILATIFFHLFDNYYKVLFNAVKGSLYREVYQRVFTLALIIIYYYSAMNFWLFILLYVAGYGLPTLMLLVSLIRDGEFSLKKDQGFITPALGREIIHVSLFNIIIGFSNIAILNIDSIMINRLVGLEETGIYSIAFFFGTLVIIPSRILMKISGTFLADAWKTKDLEQIKSIYYKTSINQFIIGGLILIGLWGNIDNVFKILPPEFEPGRYVILLIGLTNLVEMLGGASATIISVSDRYKVLSYFLIVLLILIVATNLLLIPLLGINGAALASLLSYSIYVMLRYTFLYRNYQMQPFTFNHIKVVIIALVTYGLQSLIPVFTHFILDIAIRSFAMIMLYSSIAYVWRTSDELVSFGSLIISKLRGITHKN